MNAAAGNRDEGVTCDSCAKTNSGSIGLYTLTCLECCTRLVLSTHPDKRQASAMLAVIERMPGNPGRAQVLESVARCLEKRRSPGPRSTSA